MTKRPGTILPLALIMTFTILLAGIGIGTVVLEGSQRAKDTDESVSAYYMADSGIERQLFEIRKRSQTLAYVAALGSAYPNAARWESTAGLEQTTQKAFSSIPSRTFEVLDLFDPDNLSAAAGIDEIRVTFSGSGQLELGYAQWKSGASVLWPDDDAFALQIGFAPSMSLTGLDPTKAYRLRLRAVNGDVTSAVIQVYRGGVMQTFPGDITLGAEGTYGKASQKIVVTMPKLDVLSGLYSYVVFSECQLLKGLPGSPVCP
ncbi:hypothetical protein KJ925_00585 [Patescibacteria group bacterium]|nr:hypothetical protein [Patescibacteria group bacterium]